jgi:hypothetical protein
MGNLTTKENNIGGNIVDNNLKKLITLTANDPNYQSFFYENYNQDIGKNELLKRAYCTGNTTLPFLLPYYDITNKKLDTYSVNIDVLNLRVPLDINNKLEDNINAQGYTDTQRNLNYSHQTIDKITTSRANGCSFLYTGKSGNEYDKHPDEKWKGLCGYIYNNDNMKYKFNYSLYEKTRNGNNFKQNPFPDCNCINSIYIKDDENNILIQKDITNIPQPSILKPSYAQIFDNKCSLILNNNNGFRPYAQNNFTSNTNIVQKICVNNNQVKKLKENTGLSITTTQLCSFSNTDDTDYTDDTDDTYKPPQKPKKIEEKPNNIIYIVIFIIIILVILTVIYFI